MGKYMDAIKNLKRATPALPKLTEPIKEGIGGFVSTYPARLKSLNVPDLVGDLAGIIRRCDVSKGMSPEAVNDLLAEGDVIYSRLPDGIGQAVFRAVDGLGPWPELELLPILDRMEVCFDGKSCRQLESKPSERPICLMAGKSPSDLNRCPINRWEVTK
jgi:hypothetical protein